MNAHSWYYIFAGQQHGPVSVESLRTVPLTNSSLIWRQGMREWTQVQNTELHPLPFTPTTVLQTEPPVLPAPSAFTGTSTSTLATSLDNLTPASQPAPSKPERSNYLIRHWRGEHPLAQAYWVNGILVSSLYTFFTGIIGFRELDLTTLAIAELTLIPVSYSIVVWQIVGLFRSLRNRQSPTQNSNATVLGWLAFSILAFSHPYRAVVHTIPTAADMIDILRGDPQIQPTKIQLLPSGTEIEISGGIRAGSARELIDFLEKTPRVKILQIDSTGGRVLEAIKMAEVVKKRQMTTFVSNNCMSAATLIFLAGKQRFVQEGAKMGFHSGSLRGGTTKSEASLNERISEYLVAAGVTADFVQRIKNTPFTTMWYPKVPELLAARVITSETQGDRFGMSSSVVQKWETMDIHKMLTRMPELASLQEADPELVQELLHNFQKAVTSGASEGEAEQRTRENLNAKVEGLLPFASDAALINTYRLLLKLTQLYSKTHPEYLAYMLSGQKDPNPKSLKRMLPNYPLQEDIQNTVEVLRSSKARIHVPVDKALAAQDFEAVLAKLEEIHPAHVVNLENLEQMVLPAEAPKFVETYDIYIKTIFNVIPENRQGNLFRFLLLAAADSPQSPNPAATPTKAPEPQPSLTLVPPKKDAKAAPNPPPIRNSKATANIVPPFNLSWKQSPAHVERLLSKIGGKVVERKIQNGQCEMLEITGLPQKDLNWASFYFKKEMLTGVSLGYNNDNLTLEQALEHTAALFLKLSAQYGEGLSDVTTQDNQKNKPEITTVRSYRWSGNSVSISLKCFQAAPNSKEIVNVVSLEYQLQ